MILYRGSERQTKRKMERKKKELNITRERGRKSVMYEQEEKGRKVQR